MVAWTVTLIYLAIGYFLGRKAFVRILGDSPRKNKSTGGLYNFWTPEFTGAFWTAISLLILWPVSLPVSTMFRDTPTEQNAKLAKQKQQLEQELRRLELKYDLDFRKEKWNA